jgi:hypothetical protein
MTEMQRRFGSPVTASGSVGQLVAKLWPLTQSDIRRVIGNLAKAINRSHSLVAED